ncbi:hypothetical protein ACFQ2M_41250 [Kitasatospora saccharophila]|uniref:hypothetical protein n=1 Tax=Kitasatospora saccharophila TaxID=407973 RepID=UPI00363C317B
MRRAARLAFPEPSALAADPVHAARLHRYLTDLLAPYGLSVRTDAPGTPGLPGAPDAPDAGSPGPPVSGQSYGEMAEALIRAVVPAGEQVDLLVLAHSVPDLTPGRATACRLGHVCPGAPLSFAVSGQDGTAAFTALRLLTAYADSAGLRRALLLVVEQDALPYDPGVPVALPAVSRGVALLFGDPLPGERVLRLDPAGITPAGPHPADPAQPGTGLWWELGALSSPEEAPDRTGEVPR